jgi:long-chain fatty acid transport protein
MRPHFTMKSHQIFGKTEGYLLCIALAVSVVGSHAQAAAFALHEHSIKSMGTAYAGAGANAGEEAATIAWNPAGMSYVNGSQLDVVGVYVTTTLDFENKGSSQSLLTAGGMSTVPGTGPSDNGGTDGFIPSLYAVTGLNDRLKVGLGIYAPFGLSTEYEPNWVGRYHAIKSSLKTISISPALSYQVTDGLSIGVGAAANYIDAELTQAVFVLDPLNGQQLPDGHAKVAADDWGYSFNAGIVYALNEAMRMGISYRSNINHTLTGYRALTSVGPLSGQVGARTDLELPESIVGSAYERLGDKWSIMADLMWTRWSRFEKLRIRFDDNSPDNVTQYDWNDSWRFSVGSEYRPTSRWSIRGGLALDQSPIPNAQRRDPRLPGTDRRWVTVGATYRPNDLVSVDFAYAYVKLKDAEINNTIDLTSGVMPGAFTDTLVGSYDSDSHLVGIEVSIDL